MLTYILNKPQEQESYQAEGGSRGAGGGLFWLAPILTVPRQAPADSPDNYFPVQDNYFPIPDNYFPIPDKYFPIPENYFLILKKFFKISCQSFYVFRNNAVPSETPILNKINDLFLLAEA